ncbi:MAG: PAS domain S-box protein [Elusimicrobiales bacterium]|nr:PAS domain S-box protein [Elusimicrobiales bacterium]
MDKQKGFLEESLAESQGKDVCRALFDGSPDAIFLADPKTGLVLDANPAAAELLGRPIEEIIGLHQTALHPPRKEAASTKIFKDHSSARDEARYNRPIELYALRADGTEVPIEITSKIIKIKGRKVLQGFFRDVSDRKAAERALKESETKFKTLTEKSMMGIYLIQDGLFRYVNPVLADIFGCKAEELIDKKGPKDLVLPEDWPLVEENLRRRMEGKVKSLNYGFRGVKKGGEIFYVEVFGTRIDYLGRPAIIGSIQDVTERKRAQEALLESEERYRTLVSHAPIGIVVHRNGVMKFVNRRLAELGKLSDPEVLLGRNIMDFLHPGSRKAAAERLQALNESGVPLGPADHKLVAPDGRVLDMEMTSIPITFQGEACVMSIIQDVTARKRAQDELRESETRYRSLVSHVPMGIVVHALGQIRFANGRMAEMVRSTQGALLGRSVMDFIHPDYRDMVRERIGLAAREGTTLPPAEEKLLALDGTVVDVEINSVPITYRGENCLMALVHDISARRRSQEAVTRAQMQLMEANARLEERVEERTSQLEELNKELEAFSYSAAHDLKAPLRRINIFSDMLEKEAGGTLRHDTHDYLLNIHKSVTLMTRLVDGLLSLSTTGRRPLDLEPVALSPLLEEAVADVKAENAGRNIEWRLGKLPQLNCDRAMLRQVFVNLLGNAAKYSRGSDPAVIEVSCTAGPRERVIAVRDNGIGFSMEYADKIFGVFQRLHKSDAFEGTGIGLSTVKRIISRHGGRVWAESAPGKGATFYFSLPVK